MQRFDPVTLEILWRRLVSIVDEADAAVVRTAFSSVLRDSHDYTCMFTDSRGRELAQGTLASPGQSGAMALGIKKLINSRPADFFRPGDVFITNDPWALAGHLNDVCVLSPVFRHDRLMAFTACILHHADVGGRVASNSHDVFEEGLFLPLVRLYGGEQPNEDIFNIIRANVRTPEQVQGDIRSQIAANHVCAQHILQLLNDYRLDDLDELADEIIRRSERSLREAIARIPDGTYRASGTIEQMEGQAPVEIRCELSIKGSDVVVDLSGTTRQVEWGGNVVFNFTYAYVHMAIKSIFDPELPNNEGTAAPITLIAPEGTVVNCRHPAPVVARMQIGHFMTEIIYRALAPVLPDRVIAGSGGTPATMQVFFGTRSSGDPFHAAVIRGGGMGAGAAGDGSGSFVFPANAANTPVEIFESDTPLVIRSRELLADSGGAGKFRGAQGRREVIWVPDDDKGPPGNIGMALQSGRFQLAPEGLFGGRPGRLARFTVNGRPADSYGLTRLKKGHLVEFDTAGGGGFGDPAERDDTAVARDVASGRVTPERAALEYRFAHEAGAARAGGVDKAR